MNLNDRNSPESPDISQSDNHLTLRILEMLKRTNYDLVQENGQRRMTAPELSHGKKERIKGAEVFLGRLPRDCYEDELVPILELVGRTLELRLMLDFSGSTRGYAFALFENVKTARRACAELDGYEIRPGHRIGVVKSVDNCRLFFGGVPKDKSKEEFLEDLSKILEGIVDVYLYPSAQDKTLNRGFIFVEFKDHRAAAMARRRLIPGKITLWSHQIAVDWADPEPGDPVDDDVMETVTALFVRNLSLDTSHQRVKDVFQKVSGVPILKLKKINHFAFLHYQNRQAAEHVLNVMTRSLENDNVPEAAGWEVHWAKPIGATKHLERQRHINEAVAKLSEPKQEPRGQNQNKNAKKRGGNKHGEYVARRKETSSATHMNILENFVRLKFGAFCSFNCVTGMNENRYICNITVHQDEKILFRYQGELMPTKDRAITAACARMYQDLSSWVLGNARQILSQNCIKEEMAVNMMAGSPLYYRN